MVNVYSHPTDELLRVSLDDGSDVRPDAAGANVMDITPGHPVYVEERGWVKAEDLAIGDRLRLADGGWARVLAIERVVLDAPQVVYNFTVAGVHSYFVLEVGVLVHNCRPTKEYGYHGPSGGYRNQPRWDDPPIYNRGEDLHTLLVLQRNVAEKITKKRKA